jgi:hypothetical protein
MNTYVHQRPRARRPNCSTRGIDSALITKLCYRYVRPPEPEPDWSRLRDGSHGTAARLVAVTGLSRDVIAGVAIEATIPANYVTGVAACDVITGVAIKETIPANYVTDVSASLIINVVKTSIVRSQAPLSALSGRDSAMEPAILVPPQPTVSLSTRSASVAPVSRPGRCPGLLFIRIPAQSWAARSVVLPTAPVPAAP